MKKIFQFILDLKLYWKFVKQDRAERDSKIRVNITPEQLLKFSQGETFEVISTYEAMPKLIFYDIIIALNNSITNKDYLEAERDFAKKAKESNIEYDQVRNPIKSVIKSYTKQDLIKHLHAN